MKNRKLIRIISSFTVALSCLFCIIVALSFIIKADDAVEATGSVEADPVHVVRAASEGVIESVFVRDGSEVKQGDAIASQKNEEFANQIEELKLTVLNLQERRLVIQSRLNYLKTKAHLSEIDALIISRNKENLALKAATTEKDAAENEKVRIGTLLNEGLTSQRQYQIEVLRHHLLEIKEDQQKGAISKIDQDIKIAEDRHKDELLNLTFELEQNKLEDQKARLQIAHLENKVARSFINSPRKGIIILGQEPEKLIGQQLRPGDKVADLIDFSSMVFKASVPETYIRKLKEGQSVNLEIKALPYQKFKIFKGIVRQIAKQASSDHAVTDKNATINITKMVDYDVKVQLFDNTVNIPEQGENNVFYLKPGFSGTARIIVSHDLRLINWLRIQLFGDSIN
jgi:multidrug resistance efflux pump